MQIAVDGGTLRVTVSVGVAQYGVDGTTPEELFKAADRRLYQAKLNGRNQVVGLNGIDMPEQIARGPAADQGNRDFRWS